MTARSKIMWTYILKILGLHRPKDESGPKEPAPEPAPAKKTYQETRSATPNKSRRSIRPRAILLHHSGGSYAGGVSWIKSPKSKVSYHCLISRDGRRTVFGEDTERMWHAGVSNYAGKKDANSWSIGVSFEGDSYKEPLSEDMIASAIEFIGPRMDKWGISAEWVLDHRMVSSPRKNDLNPEEYRRFMNALKRSRRG